MMITLPHNELPKVLSVLDITVNELLYYQYLPIKLLGQTQITIEPRLHPFQKLIGIVCCDYVGVYGLDEFVNSYVYITVKRLMQSPLRLITRPGWHCDGFMTDDINYIWSDCQPTIFNNSNFILSQDDRTSIEEMGYQAVAKNNIRYDNRTLLRLNQFCVHKADDTPYTGVRTFVKLSFSRDQYDLIGNSHNYLLDYGWKMRPRENFRNVPQEINYDR